VLRAVTKVRPNVKFLALSVSDAAEDVIAVVRAGARGYVTKSIEVRNWSRPSLARRRVTPSSLDAWLASCLTPSQIAPRRIRSRPHSTRNSINSLPVKSKYFVSSRGDIHTATSPDNSKLPSRLWRVTSQRFAQTPALKPLQLTNWATERHLL